MQRLKEAKKKTVGAKQSIKALEKGTACLVFVADDADKKMVAPVLELSQTSGIQVVKTGSMKELGKACGIQVGTAVAAILNT